MPTEPKLVWTTAGAARLKNCSEETFARGANKAGIVPTVIIVSGTQMRPAYDEEAIQNVEVGAPPLHVMTRALSDRLVAARSDVINAPEPLANS